VTAGGEHHDSIAAPPLLAAAVLLGLVCTALYANTGASEFVGSDASEIVENAALHWRELSLANARAALAHAHPVTAVSYGLNHRLGRLDVHGYHAVNTAIHFANALLVFALARVLFGRIAATAKAGLSEEAAPWAALAAAALFAADPLQVEAVTWISRRGTLLATGFGLVAALCWMRGRSAEPRSRAGWWSAAIAGWLLACSSHEVAVVVPFAIALCDWLWRGERAAGGARFAHVTALLIAIAVSWMAVRDAPALALHESLLVWPLPGRLSLVHEVGGSLFARGGAVALQLVLLGAAFALARRHRVASFALLWFIGVHAALAALGSSPGTAEHQNYFALIGPALGAGYALFAALPRRLGLATAISVLAVAGLGAATHARNEQWRRPELLWDDAVNENPRDADARLERGALRESRGDAAGALADFTEAVQLAPDSAAARTRLAASLAGLGREREALPHAREAVAIDPKSGPAHAALGRILASVGELEPAAAEFALALDGDPGVERSLGDTLVRLSRFEESLSHYRAAIERDPGDDDARTGMGAALVELGRAQDALAYLEPAVESQPNPRYLAHFADALWQLGDAGGALDAATMAVRVAPNWPGATTRLAWMLALCPDRARRDPPRALRIAEIALSQSGAPDAQLLDARAAALAAAGRFADAHADAERAAALARDAGATAIADAISAHAQSYARRKPWPDPPRPFEASP
jgi:tetratricopeptide (TPR) repeat protein